jgi:hypothetical protein
MFKYNNENGLGAKLSKVGVSIGMGILGAIFAGYIGYNMGFNKGYDKSYTANKLTEEAIKEFNMAKEPLEPEIKEDPLDKKMREFLHEQKKKGNLPKPIEGDILKYTRIKYLNPIPKLRIE